MTVIPPPCGHRRHRSTDWMLPDVGMAVCGVCHPPATGLAVLRRGERGWKTREDEWRRNQLATVLRDPAKL